MTKEGEVFGPATVRWNDYVGTAAADDARVTANSPSLYELAELDRDEWVFVGVELVVRDRAPEVTIFAVSRKDNDVQTYADVEQLGVTSGHIPVTAFHLGDITQVEEFLNGAFSRIAIRLVAAPVSDQALVIAGNRDVRPSRAPA